MPSRPSGPESERPAQTPNWRPHTETVTDGTPDAAAMVSWRFCQLPQRRYRQRQHRGVDAVDADGGSSVADHCPAAVAVAVDCAVDCDTDARG